VAWRLDGRIALVTGASSGLGASFASTLAAHGAHVIAAARNQGALAKVAEQIAHAGGRCDVAHLDVADANSITALCEKLQKVDILVNNAGIARTVMAIDHGEADWDAVLNTNLKGQFLLARGVANVMRGQAAGSIINIASVVGLRQVPGLTAYAVSKAGLIQMTKQLALEWARYGIRVNAIAPGYFETDLNTDFWKTEPGRAMIQRVPMRRLGRKGELDGALMLLASDASTYMTGSVIEVDGGHLVSSL